MLSQFYRLHAGDIFQCLIVSNQDVQSTEETNIHWYKRGAAMSLRQV